MSRVPIGKVLLRNVIRHTDAHNKIQEESEMWKMRDWEKETTHNKHSPAPECMRGSMHCDRVPDYSRDQIGSREREGRYWTRKLYEFEAGDPDRWGHSGFKELYPEEFESAGEEASGTKKNGHKMKKSKSSKETSISKRSKKSSRKKKKKKKEEEKRKRAEGSSSDGSSRESNAATCKQGRKRTKSKHKNKKTGRSRGREKDSSSEESDDEGERERTHCHRKRKQDAHKGSDSGMDAQKKRRKNWKAQHEVNSDDSSGD